MRLRRAFTLIELLIVIGIIAVLVALLLPILGRAREAARCAQCAANCRSISQALIAYAMQNNSFLPASENPGVFWSPTSYRAYYFQPGSFSDSGKQNLDLSHGLVMPYLGDSIDTRAAMMRCPDANPAAPNYSYDINEHVGNDVNHLTQVKRPSEKIILFENDVPDDGHFNLGGGIDMPSIHHYGRTSSIQEALTSPSAVGYGNYGFADGHVETLSRAYLNASANTFRGDLSK